jgi:hypothetical protein
MRAILLFFLLTGCSAFDKLADNGSSYASQNRVYLGGEQVDLAISEDLNRYTCGRKVMLCEAWGRSWSCSCVGSQF